MKEMQQFFRKNSFLLLASAILLLAVIFRFYNFANRWGLGGDQAHFVLLSRYSIETFQLPFLGPFSSAGPYQTGGEWYWFVMLGDIWNMHSVLSPWIFLAFTYVVFVAGTLYVGKKMLGNVFGLIVGLLAALSTAQILQSTNLSNQSPISLLSLLAIGAMFAYIKKKKFRYLFLEAFAIGLASATHLQGVALIPLLLLTLIFTKTKHPKAYLLVILGLLIPWLPVFWIDFHHNFFNTKNMIYYYFFEKNKASYDVLGRRWLTFLTQFTPTAWGNTIGGYVFVGYVGIIASIVAIAYQQWKRKIAKEWYILFLSIPCMFAILRYTRTPLFDSYYVFLHPLILLVTAWALFQIGKINKYIGIILLLIILVTTFMRDMHEVSYQTVNINPARAVAQKKFLEKNYPDKKFVIYDYQFKTSAYSQSLSMYLDADRKIDDHGIMIGYISLSHFSSIHEPQISKYKATDEYILIDLSHVNPETLKKDWVLVTPKGIYDAQENWWK